MWNILPVKLIKIFYNNVDIEKLLWYHDHILIQHIRRIKKMIKKIFAVATAAVMTFAMSVSAFAAGSIDANEQKILDELNAKKVPAEYVTQAKNYFEKDDVTVTADQATAIIANIDDAAQIAKSAGIKTKADLDKASAATIDSIVAKASAAAKVINLTVSYDAKKGVATIKDTKGNVVATTNVGTKKTGADSTSTIAVVSFLGLAVAVLAVVTKKNAKAEA